MHEVYHSFDTIPTHATELHLILVQALVRPELTIVSRNRCVKSFNSSTILYIFEETIISATNIYLETSLNDY